MHLGLERSFWSVVGCLKKCSCCSLNIESASSNFAEGLIAFADLLFALFLKRHRGDCVWVVTDISCNLSNRQLYSKSPPLRLMITVFAQKADNTAVAEKLHSESVRRLIVPEQAADSSIDSKDDMKMGHEMT